MRLFVNKGMRRWCGCCGEKFVYTSKYHRVCDKCNASNARRRNR